MAIKNPLRTEERTVHPEEAETAQVNKVDLDRAETERIRDAAFDRRDVLRTVQAQPVTDPAGFAEKRKRAELDLADEDQGDNVPRQQTEGAKGLRSKVTESQSLKWTGRNIDEMIEFCGPDPLGQPAATFSHEWTGDATLHVYDASVGESDEASLGVTRDVSPGQYVVRAGKRPDGGWERVYPISEDRLNRRYDTAA